jgi:hypothetical protein
VVCSFYVSLHLTQQKHKKMTKKITLATVKSFIRKNSGSLSINVCSAFDGMLDGCTSQHAGFVTAQPETKNVDMTMGIKGAWFVGSSRDYFTAFENDTLVGYEVYNSCGRFIIATAKN